MRFFKKRFKRESIKPISIVVNALDSFNRQDVSNLFYVLVPEKTKSRQNFFDVLKKSFLRTHKDAVLNEVRKCILRNKDKEITPNIHFFRWQLNVQNECFLATSNCFLECGLRNFEKNVHRLQA